jgi:hypothetical protein
MFSTKSLISKLCLDHPGLQVTPDKPDFKDLNKIVKNLFSNIRDRLDGLIQSRIYPFDRSDIKISRFENFPGANAISITNRPIKDKTSMQHLKKNKSDYLFCVKSDGTRYLWVVLEDGRQYFVARNMEIFRSRVELPPFFFRKRNQELLIYQRKVDEIPMDSRFTTPKVKISRQGTFESENHRVGRLDGLFQKNKTNRLIQAMVDTSDWKLSDLLMTKSGEVHVQEDIAKMMQFKKLYKVNEELFGNILENTSRLFEGVDTDQKKFEEWIMRKQENADLPEKRVQARFIFDGELIVNENKEWEYLLFDSLVYDRKMVIDRNYEERLKYCQIFSGKSQFYQGFFSRAKNPNQFIVKLKQGTNGFSNSSQKNENVKAPENIIKNSENPKKELDELATIKKQHNSLNSSDAEDSLFADDDDDEEEKEKEEGETKLDQTKHKNGNHKDPTKEVKQDTEEKEQGEVMTTREKPKMNPVTPVRPDHLKKRNFEEFQSESMLEKTILQPPASLLPIKLKTKDFYNYRSVDFLLDTICETVPFKENNDGIIITRINYPYIPGKTNGILKWKPDHMNSIDFLVLESKGPLKKLSDVEGTLFELYVVSKSKSILLFDFMFASSEEARKIKENFRSFEVCGLSVEGAILEMVYNKNKLGAFQSNHFLYFFNIFLLIFRKIL